MAARWTLLYAIVALILLLQLDSARAQTTYMVGDNNGWTFPPNGIATYYDDWAKQHSIRAGDSLFFDYQYNFHDVVQVSKADLDACSGANPIKSYNEGNSTVPLPTAGYYGFICGFPSHCVANMKLEVNVLNADGSPAPPGAGMGPSPSPEGAPGPAAPQSDARSRYRAISAMAFGSILAVSAFLLS